MVFRERSFNGEQFLEYLKQLHDGMTGRSYALYVDNCAIHRTVKVREWAASVGVEFVHGVPYCPQFCGIENFWGGCKREFK